MQYFLEALVESMRNKHNCLSTSNHFFLVHKFSHLIHCRTIFMWGFLKWDIGIIHYFTIDLLLLPAVHGHFLISGCNV